MPLFRASAASVRTHGSDGSLFMTLEEQFRHHMGFGPSPSERRSWERSIPVLAADLRDAGLDDIEVLLEFQLPLTSMRADVVLCGIHPRTGTPSYVVVELKQWSAAQPVDDTPDVVDVGGMGFRLHPSAQVARYCEHIADFVASFEGDTHGLRGVAYLHNANDLSVSGLWTQLPDTPRTRLFTRERRGQFLQYLTQHLSPSPGAASADLLLGSAVRPSRQLLALAAEEVQHREQFVLQDQQQTAYSLVLRAVQRSYQGNNKQAIVITGGPGSGKSVIALSLMGELARKGRTVLHATGSSAFTQTLRRVAGARAPRVKRMFRYYNQFIDAEPNGIDVLINDEAHRIKETSTNRFTRASLRSGRPQVEELIDAARVPVFLLDEHQVVRPSEKGTVGDIRAAAARLGCDVVEISLDDQWRCGGSRLYEQWVLRLLGLEPGGPTPWAGDDNFEVEIADGPSALERHLEDELSRGYSARMAAGYCWNWSLPVPDGTLVPDVVIGDWKRPWNNRKETSHGGAPGTPFWATDPAGFAQVGCVYTAQGFEYDYSGVIIRPDLVWRSGRFVTRPEFNRDSQLKRGTPEEIDSAIRNTYKVLLTRGMRGTTLFAVDPATQNAIRALVS